MPLKYKPLSPNNPPKLFRFNILKLKWDEVGEFGHSPKFKVEQNTISFYLFNFSPFFSLQIKFIFIIVVKQFTYTRVPGEKYEQDMCPVQTLREQWPDRDPERKDEDWRDKRDENKVGKGTFNK